MRKTIQQRLEDQKLTVGDGETAIRYGTVARLSAALTMLANKALPTSEARIHVGRCVRFIKELAEERNAERQHIQQAHRPDPGTVTEDKDSVAFRDAVGMSMELTELDETVIVVKLPKPIKSTMLPVNSKATPNNEDGLAAILADLGPLYEIPEDGE